MAFNGKQSSTLFNIKICLFESNMSHSHTRITRGICICVAICCFTSDCVRHIGIVHQMYIYILFFFAKYVQKMGAILDKVIVVHLTLCRILDVYYLQAKATHDSEEC